jgi:hypothetical protein
MNEALVQIVMVCGQIRSSDVGNTSTSERGVNHQSSS